MCQTADPKDIRLAARAVACQTSHALYQTRKEFLDALVQFGPSFVTRAEHFLLDEEMFRDLLVDNLPDDADSGTQICNLLYYFQS